MAKVDPVQRRIVADELQFLNVQLVHIKSHLSQLNRLHHAGLTPKEQNYLSYRFDALDAEVVKIHALWERCHRKGGAGGL